MITIRNTTIRDNEAEYGGGIFVTLSEIFIEDCLIESNEARRGSALYFSNQSRLEIRRSRIVNNNSLGRCAIELNNLLATIIHNSVIANNQSANANAIAVIATNGDQLLDIFNTTIIGGAANKQLITYLTGFFRTLDVRIDNCIVAHQDISYTRNMKEYTNGVLNVNHKNCYFQGSTVIGTGTGTLFSDIDGDLLLNADYSVNECSPVVDAGYNLAVYTSTDIDGNPRIVDVVDIGAYEAQSSCMMARKSTVGNTLEEVSIEVFPSPTSGIFRIESASDNMIFTLYDTFGKQLLRSQNKDLDISDYPNGMYIIKAEKDGKFISSTKLFKVS